MADDQVKYIISIKDDGSASLDRLSSSLKKVKTDIGDVKSGADQTGPSFMSLAGSFTAGGLAVSAITGAINLATSALSSIGTTIFETGKQAIDLAGKFEMTKVSFTVMTGSAEKANTLLKDLTEFARTTPFTLTGVEDASRQLLAYGVESKNMVKTLTNLGQIASGTNIPIEQMANTYGQVMVKGKLAGQEVLQFFNAGVPITKLLAENMGITTGEVEDMVSKGEIGFPKVQEVLEGLTEEGGKFAGMFDQANGTFEQMSSNLSDKVNIYLRELGEELLPTVKEVMKELDPLIDSVGNYLKDNLPLWIDRFRNISTYLYETFKPKYEELWDSFKTGIKDVYDTLKPHLENLGLAFGDFYLGSITNGIDFVKSLWDMFVKLVEILGPPIIDVITALIPIVKGMNDIYIKSAEFIFDVVTAIGTAAEDTGLIGAFNGIVNFITGFLNPKYDENIKKLIGEGGVKDSKQQVIDKNKDLQNSLDGTKTKLENDMNPAWQGHNDILKNHIDTLSGIPGELVHLSKSQMEFSLQLLSFGLDWLGLTGKVKENDQAIKDVTDTQDNVWKPSINDLKWLIDGLAGAWKQFLDNLDQTRDAVLGAIIWMDQLIQKAKEALAAKQKVGSSGGWKTGGHVGFADGGFTAGGIDDIAGAVHGGEWVAPAWMVNAMPSLFGNLEGVRQGNTYNQPITVNANIQDNTDFRLLMNEMAFNLRSN